MKDPYGKACLDFFNGKKDAHIRIDSEVAEMDPLPAGYLFRSPKDMPDIEQKALGLAKGRVLDVGAGAGAHALALQALNMDVHALEVSPLLCQLMHKRGVEQVIETDIYKHNGTTYDSILFLMNGIGMCRNFEGLKKLLAHLKGLLNPGGQVLLDSSDLIFMFIDEDGTIDLPLTQSYYGEFPFTMQYADQSMSDQWLYIDFDNLKDIASQCGFACEFVKAGEHYDYLAKLYVNNVRSM